MRLDAAQINSKIAVIGAGWAGLSAAIALQQQGRQVTVFEAAPQAGGRARTVRWQSGGQTLEIDNGQHILIGAYQHSLRLMAALGVDLAQGLERLPFGLPLIDGWKMRAPRWPAPFHLIGALLGSGYAFKQRWQMIQLGLRLLRGLRGPGLSVQQWLGDLSGPVWLELIAPLCIAALNTPPADACAWRFAQVLRQTLLGGSRAADFLVPRTSLSRLFADAAMQYLNAAKVDVRLSTAVRSINATATGVIVAGENFDQVVVATSPHVAGGLVGQASLQQRLDQLHYEPIATAYLRLDPAKKFMPHAVMIALPAQAINGLDPAWGDWLFSRQLTSDDGSTAPVLAVVTSAARAALTMPREAWLDRITAQLRGIWPQLPGVMDRTLIVEKRATFSCRPHAAGVGNHTNHPRVWLAGDYTEAALPATLEAAVISGQKVAGLIACASLI